MPATREVLPFICSRCRFGRATDRSRLPPSRRFNTVPKFHAANSSQPLEYAAEEKHDADSAKETSEKGAMTRRLERMTNDSIESNPRRAAKIVEGYGFSDELKARLEARIAEGNSKAENQAAFSLNDLPSSAGQGTRDQAAAAPWTGQETLEEAALRMLDDAKPRLSPGNRAKPKLSNMSVDTRMKNAVKQSAGQRLGNARDKASVYAQTKDNKMSEAEKEEFRKIMKARFQPGARAVPQTIQGLESLASERIEDAIARGLFKNIPRGKGVNTERDYTANSPFIDTTEYFMNKIIQKQEVLPPWVEKQQEVTRQAAQFRSRLRNEWKRHAARSIASKGGTLEQQIRRAEAFAKAEELVNPRRVKEQTITTIDGTGNLEHITVANKPPERGDQGTEITIIESTTGADGPTITHVEASATMQGTASAVVPPTGMKTEEQDKILAAPYPFRDPTWESTELSYHTLALKSLNDLTRSYNLMAPELAKKPYFSLERELKACFADVASLLPNEIKERARAPPKKSAFEVVGHRRGGVMEKFGGEKVRVYESTKPQYGLKEFWRDLFAKSP